MLKDLHFRIAYFAIPSILFQVTVRSGGLPLDTFCFRIAYFAIPSIFFQVTVSSGGLPLGTFRFLIAYFAIPSIFFQGAVSSGGLPLDTFAVSISKTRRFFTKPRGNPGIPFGTSRILSSLMS